LGIEFAAIVGFSAWRTGWQRVRWFPIHGNMVCPFFVFLHRLACGKEDRRGRND